MLDIKVSGFTYSRARFTNTITAWQGLASPDAVGICFSFCLTGASIKKCNFISFQLLIKLLTCASPPRRINSCLYKQRWKLQRSRGVAGGDSVEGQLQRFAEAPPPLRQAVFILYCEYTYINRIKLQELCKCLRGSTAEVITHTDSIIERGNC